ncbi:MAG TPA: AAA family ATPase, partial [Deltaproteobacteria bacterium]|nr:AAA family ATPase [Deltaproteobacteria bacterium]
MRLSRIEIRGFKSVARKTALVISDGVTCIAGPNGCGKSNIVDAVRWALGEQSPKALRASSMNDVIFSGTQ